MTTKLTEPQLRALRILAVHDEVRESNRTNDGSDGKPATIYWQVADSLDKKWLAQDHYVDGYRVWSIRAKGRQVLAEDDAGGS